MTAARITPTVHFLIGFAALIAIWAWCSSGISYIRIPSPSAVAIRWMDLVLDGSLIAAFEQSFERILIGFLLASALGITLGLLAGVIKPFGDGTIPIHAFLRYIPPTAFIPSLIFYFGIGEGLQYAVVFFSIYFFIFQMTVDAVRSIDPRFIDMALNSGLKNVSLLRHVYLPYAGPRLLQVMRINFAGAWTFLIAGEIIGATTGMGRMIANAFRFGDIESAFAVMLSFGLIGILADLFFSAAMSVLFPWHRYDRP